MRAALAKRLDALEPRESAIYVPNVIAVAHDETAADALVRFRRDYAGRIPSNHRVIVLPARVTTPEDELDFARRFLVQQTQLVASSKTLPPKNG